LGESLRPFGSVDAVIPRSHANGALFAPSERGDEESAVWFCGYLTFAGLAKVGTLGELSTLDCIMKIGILAVQGDYEAHARMLERLGADYIFVRTPEEVAQVDAIILPGGESTTMLKFLKEEGLESALRALDARGGAFFGTCAGAILLAREVRSPAQESLGFADLVITRNAYGRQLASEVRTSPSKLKSEPLEMVFIRAPWIDQVGPGVEVLAREGGRPVLVRDGRILIATFHPELTGDTTVHEYFLKLAAEQSSASRVSRNISPQRGSAERSPTARQ
jgi:pyridoxal 5'-phosphate synthase pdxT subunit